MKEPEDSAPFKMISMRKIFRITLFIAAIAAAAWGCVGVYEDSSELALGWKSNVESISPQELNSIITAGEDVLVIDVREEGEYYEGNIPGSVNISKGVLEFSTGDAEFWAQQFMYPPEAGSKIVICSRNGDMGVLAAISLKKSGYKNVLNLEGGFESYKQLFN
jgi:rhodanese-related sulfurtransferase